jgi:hypothetical protein
MKKVLVLFIIITCLALSKAEAQSQQHGDDYSTAIGIKFYPTALSIKHFVNDDAAIEGLGYFWNYGFRLTGLYEFHHDIEGVDGLKWYIGPGVHFTAYNTNYGGASAVGLDGVLGLDYKFEDAPVAISVDWQPSIEFGNGFNSGFYNMGGIGIRYAF